MRLPSAVRPLAQVAVLAAIVATLLYLPTAVLLIGVSHAFGISFDAFVTFGGALGPFLGLAAWWMLAFAAACIYALFAFPWDEKVLSWPKKG
jgi:hypothetical protein